MDSKILDWVGAILELDYFLAAGLVLLTLLLLAGIATFWSLVEDGVRSKPLKPFVAVLSFAVMSGAAYKLACANSARVEEYKAIFFSEIDGTYSALSEHLKVEVDLPKAHENRCTSGSIECQLNYKGAIALNKLSARNVRELYFDLTVVSKILEDLFGFERNDVKIVRQSEAHRAFISQSIDNGAIWILLMLVSGSLLIASLDVAKDLKAHLRMLLGLKERQVPPASA